MRAHDELHCALAEKQKLKPDRTLLRAEAMRLLRGGETAAAICARLRISRSTLSTWKKDLPCP